MFSFIFNDWLVECVNASCLNCDTDDEYMDHCVLYWLDVCYRSVKCINCRNCDFYSADKVQDVSFKLHNFWSKPWQKLGVGMGLGEPD